MGRIRANSVNAIVLRLVRLPSLEAVRDDCRRKLKLTPPEVEAGIEEARRLLTLAAEGFRDSHLVEAIERLQNLFVESYADGEGSTALQVQKELNRLLGLYGQYETTAEDEATIDTDDLVRRHLVPLQLTDAADTPTDELARLAVAEILRLRRHA